jgi:protein-S-isoprenylcysteine O-methyltransferase Ste14
LQQHSGRIVRLGGALFTWRTSLPLPIAVALVLIPSQGKPWAYLWPGTAIVVAGEALRLWAVRQIGVISRTRSGRLGPLVASGPFAFVRNPLYLGNILIWAGFSIAAGLIWFAPLVVALLAFVYHAIVRWEEGLLESRLGESYRAYVAQVPRWIPFSGAAGNRTVRTNPFSWRDTLFSERGTLIAIAVGYGLLSVKFL